MGQTGGRSGRRPAGDRSTGELRRPVGHPGWGVRLSFQSMQEVYCLTCYIKYRND
jgi:hypothetical protein